MDRKKMQTWTSSKCARAPGHVLTDFFVMSKFGIDAQTTSSHCSCLVCQDYLLEVVTPETLKTYRKWVEEKQAARNHYFDFLIFFPTCPWLQYTDKRIVSVTRRPKNPTFSTSAWMTLIQRQAWKSRRTFQLRPMNLVYLSSFAWSFNSP